MLVPTAAFVSLQLPWCNSFVFTFPRVKLRSRLLLASTSTQIQTARCHTYELPSIWKFFISEQSTDSPVRSHRAHACVALHPVTLSLTEQLAWHRVCDSAAPHPIRPRGREAKALRVWRDRRLAIALFLQPHLRRHGYFPGSRARFQRHLHCTHTFIHDWTHSTIARGCALSATSPFFFCPMPRQRVRQVKRAPITPCDCLTQPVASQQPDACRRALRRDHARS